MQTNVLGTIIIICLLAMALSSCSSSKQMACPSFGSNKMVTKKNKRHKSFKLDLTGIFKNNTRQSKRFYPAYLNFQTKSLQFNASQTHKTVNPVKIKPSSLISSQKEHKHTIKIKNVMSNFQIQKEEPKQPEQMKSISQAKSKRKLAMLNGGAIVLMAIAAGVSIPALGTLTASIGLLVILLLDLFVSAATYKYYKEEKPRLALFTGVMRLVYSGIFGIGIGYHLAGNVAMFTKFWEFGLITFGIHLIALGLLYHNEGGKKWVNIAIKSLLIIAGVGYMAIHAGTLVVPNPVAFKAAMESVLMVPMIVGEISFAFWMLFKGGKSALKAAK